MKKQTLFMACLLLSNMCASSLMASAPQEEEWSPTPTPTPYSALETNNETLFVERKETKEGASSLSVSDQEAANHIKKIKPVFCILGQDISKIIFEYLNSNPTKLYGLQNEFRSQLPKVFWHPHFKAAYIHQAEERQKAANANPMRNAPAPKNDLEFIIEDKDELPQFTSSLRDEIATDIQVIIKDETLMDNDLARLSSVRNLKINRCKNITNLGLQHISEVETLGASSCTALTGDGFAGLTHLKNITLFGCNIYDADLVHLSQATHVNIRACDISDEGIAHLNPNLEVLDVSFCKPGLSSDCIAALRERGVTVLNRSM